MKLYYSTPFLLGLSLIYVGCSVQPKVSENTERQPQNSVYDEAEVYSDDMDVTDALEIAGEKGDENKNSDINRFSKICKEPESTKLAVKDRVVTMYERTMYERTMNDHKQYIAGSIKATYDNAAVVEIDSDYGPHSVSLNQIHFERNASEVSKAMECVGTETKKVYGLFQIRKNFYTGHVREVFKNGVVRFVNDKSKEQFTTIDRSHLEILHSDLKLKTVYFWYQDKELKGQIRRVFDKDTLLIKHGNILAVRKIKSVKIAD